MKLKYEKQQGVLLLNKLTSTSERCCYKTEPVDYLIASLKLT